MKKTIKYISFLFLFLLFFNNICLATDINMNLQTNEIVGNTATQNSPIQNTNNYTTISTTTSTSDDGLNLTNIINIFLVVVGIVLILLGLAILIRLKY